MQVPITGQPAANQGITSIGITHEFDDNYDLEKAADWMQETEGETSKDGCPAITQFGHSQSSCTGV